MIIPLLREFKALQVLDLISPQMEIMIWLVKKLTNLGDGVSPSAAVTRKQLDSSGFGDIKADINLKKFLQY